MKKLISVFLCLLLLVALTAPVLATSEVTEPEDEVIAWEWEGEETAYAIISTFPVEEIEGENFYWVIPEDGTYELPVDGSGAIQWDTIESDTYTIGGNAIEYYAIPEIAGDTLLQPATGSAPASWLVLVVAITAVLAILVLLVVIAILLIALIIWLVTKKKKNQPTQETEEAM